MRPRVIAAALLVAGGLGASLSACSHNPQEALGSMQTSWQVTNVYTEPNTPSSLPPEIAGRAVMVFGDSTVTGDTGCAPFHGSASFTKDGKAAPADQADRVEFSHLDLDTKRVSDESCPGASRHFHDALVQLIQGPLKVRFEGDTGLVLTEDSERVNAPAMRLTTH